MPKTRKTSDKKNPSKTAFVLGLPRDLPASDVVSKAKAQGIDITDRYVYVIRSKAKGRAGKPAGRRGRPPKVAGAKRGPKPGRKAAAASAGSLGAQFLEMALDLGLSRAEDLLVSLRQKVHQAIG